MTLTTATGVTSRQQTMKTKKVAVDTSKSPVVFAASRAIASDGGIESQLNGSVSDRSSLPRLAARLS